MELPNNLEDMLFHYDQSKELWAMFHKDLKDNYYAGEKEGVFFSSNITTLLRNATADNYAHMI